MSYEPSLKHSCLPDTVLWDCRLGGNPQMVVTTSPDLGAYMQVPSVMRKCVAFLCFQKSGNVHIVGTAFFVGVALDDTRSASYVVTARHNLLAIDARNFDDPQHVMLRINMTDGTSKFAKIVRKAWLFPEENSDVAVAPFAIPEEFDQEVFPVESFATEEVIEREAIGIGEEVFLIGLFVKHFGKHKNNPILRVGNIAAMPDEPVDAGSLGHIDAYLVEARSIGGISGSPVFVCLAGVRKNPSGTQIGGTPRYFLLGLMHGHWNWDHSKDNPVFDSDEPRMDSSGLDHINTGIAVVIPASKILSVLNAKRFEEARQAMKKSLELQNAPEPDRHE